MSPTLATLDCHGWILRLQLCYDHMESGKSREEGRSTAIASQLESALGTCSGLQRDRLTLPNYKLASQAEEDDVGFSQDYGVRKHKERAERDQAADSRNAEHRPKPAQERPLANNDGEQSDSHHHQEHNRRNHGHEHVPSWKYLESTFSALHAVYYVSSRRAAWTLGVTSAGLEFATDDCWRKRGPLAAAVAAWIELSWAPEIIALPPRRL